MQLYPYQEYFVRELNNHNIIVANWYTGAGIDYAIETYIKNIKDVGYIGYKSVFATNYPNRLNMVNISRLDKLYSSKIDILIIDIHNNNKKKLTKILDHCVVHNIKVIIKQNLHDLDIKYKHFYSDGTMTIEKDRERKLKRILKNKINNYE